MRWSISRCLWFYAATGPGHNIVNITLSDACGGGGGSALSHPLTIIMRATFCNNWEKKFFIGTLLHEWFHIFGLAHMHRRTDTQLYVKINYENIDPNFKYNFTPCNECSTYGPYECGSIMHYPKVICFKLNTIFFWLQIFLH